MITKNNGTEHAYCFRVTTGAQADWMLDGLSRQQKMISPALNDGWSDDYVGHGGGARTESSTYGSYSRSSALWMNVAPSEWSVSVPAMPTHSSRRDPELPGSLVPCTHARVRAPTCVGIAGTRIAD